MGLPEGHSQIHKVRSHGIYLCVLLHLLLGASGVYAQEDVGGSAFRDEIGTEDLIDDLGSADGALGSPGDPDSTIEVRPRVEMAVDQELGKDSTDNPPITDLKKFSTCRPADKAVTQAICSFANPDRAFVPLPHFKASSGDDSDGDDANSVPSEKFHWGPAVFQSLTIQAFQHAYALTFQEKTRRALRGPFFRDYVDSVKGLSGWDDGNRFFTNYVAHPAQGAMTGFIFIQNHDRIKKQKFGESKQYWMDRLTAFAWSTAWSTNWELGPISQSSIGNLGMKGAMGYVDLVITPTVGTGWLIGEEAIDRYLIRDLERRNFMMKVLARTFLNPMRTVANLLRFREPWYRDRPFGR